MVIAVWEVDEEVAITEPFKSNCLSLAEVRALKIEQVLESVQHV